MPTLTDSRAARRWTLCALYCAQGMPWGFVTVTLLAYLAERGADLEASARVTALATLPWSFKLVWGLVIDRFTFRPMGRRRPWVLLAQLAMGVTLLAMILDAETSVDMERFAWMVFLHNCFVSLQDVASDALAVDVLEDDERGRVNGLMWASNYLGSAIGGAGMGVVLARFGVQAAFVLQAGVLFAIVCFPLFLRERAGEKLLPWTKGRALRAPGEETTESVRDLVVKLRNAFRTWPPIIGVAYALSCQVMIGMFVTANPVFYTQELAWSQERFSALSGGLGAGAGVLGALLGGFVVDRVGVRRLITVTAILIALCCAFAGLSPLMGTSVVVATGFLLAVNFLASAQTVANFSLFMGLCSLAVAGTQFTLYMAALNLTRAQGAHIVAALGDHGYDVVYIGMGVAMLVSVPILYAIPPRQRALKSGVATVEPMSTPSEMYRTERILVRHMEDSDYDAMFAVYSDPGAMTWVGDGSPIEREECLRWIEVTKKNYELRGYGMSVLVLRDSGEVIGFCGLVHPGGQEVAELKYALLREHWGLGLATEAARGMLAYGESAFGIRRVIATTAPENEASHRVLGKCGMTHLETVPDADGDLVKTFVWVAS